ncbi:hypothetical protein N7466_005128 [Penicillium verhagenii]|uniref:uncharacterized protein n=1 Tax=Penicillium verhagenii TaxID=1562060 RepID=UPI002545369C|nr:uncharacterized protein N7466_005128 [Penicillium verhagenii]KAJ5935581.1 hypothetical protein N7466_005128 [Penicillium verhagenii]
MESMGESSTARPGTNAMPMDPDFYVAEVHGITAKFYLNFAPEELIPERYFREAERFVHVRRQPWVFRASSEYPRHVQLDAWSEVDLRYKTVFQALHKVPEFEKDLWEGGSEEPMNDNDAPKNRRNQAQVIFTMVKEIEAMMDVYRLTRDGRTSFTLKPRMVATSLDYCTGFREKYNDAPLTSGVVSLVFNPGNGVKSIIIPASATVKEEHLSDSLAGKFKILLGQLYQNIRFLRVYPDKIPDQEVFLLGIHGSKLHLLRAFFPGQKTSTLWCRREVQGPYPIPEPPQRPRAPSPPIEPHAVHVENHGADTEDNAGEVVPRTAYPPRSSSASMQESPSFNEEEWERIEELYRAARLRRVDGETALRTFRVLGTREYDLWVKDDFIEAAEMIAALHLYLLSGEAECGNLQDVFERHPVDVECEEDPEESEEEHDTDMDDDFMFTQDTTEEERRQYLQVHADYQERRVMELEDDLRRNQASIPAGQQAAASSPSWIPRPIQGVTPDYLPWEVPGNDDDCDWNDEHDMRG